MRYLNPSCRLHTIPSRTKAGGGWDGEAQNSTPYILKSVCFQTEGLKLTAYQFTYIWMDRISCQLIGALCLSALEELAMQNQRLQKWRSNIFEERVWKKIATNVKSYLIYVVQK